jgi:hypothetical protein
MPSFIMQRYATRSAGGALWKVEKRKLTMMLGSKGVVRAGRIFLGMKARSAVNIPVDFDLSIIIAAPLIQEHALKALALPRAAVEAVLLLRCKPQI